ncbi:MAG: hypothetical protein V1799_21820 [bacterium]
MDLFKSTNSSDSIYVQLRDNSNLAKQRSFINRLYNDQFQPYADRDFDCSFPQKCISHFWEMYLGCALLNSGFTLVPKNARPSSGPDFCIAQEKSHVWIEAVTPEIGKGPDSLKDVNNPMTHSFNVIPDDQIVLRFCSAIRDKYCNHLRHLSKGLVPPNDPFLIAINGAGLPIQYSGTNLLGSLPYVIQAVLPLGQDSIILDVNTKQVIYEGPKGRSQIVKKSGALVPTNIFLDCTYGFISALIFSNSHPLFTSSVELGSLSLLHNHSQLNILPHGWLVCGTEWWLEETEALYTLFSKTLNPRQD